LPALKACDHNVFVQYPLEQVMHEHIMLLAAFFVESQPPARAVMIVVVREPTQAEAKAGGLSEIGNAQPRRETLFTVLLSKQETVLWEIVLRRPWHEPCLFKVGAANQNYSAQINNNEFMRKFLLGLIAVAAVCLPLSQNAQAHWGYYHHYYGGYHQAYWHHRYWHGGFWNGGYWHPGYWYPVPVVVVAPY
jgi:hypothetical protein